MYDENKGYLMTIFSAIVAAFLFYKINLPFHNETIKCIFSVIMGIGFCALYMIEGIGKIAKCLTGFMVSYMVGLPLFLNFSRWMIPKNYQTLTVWVLIIFSALIYDVFLWQYTEDTFLDGEISLQKTQFMKKLFRQLNILNNKMCNHPSFIKTKASKNQTKAANSIKIKEKKEKEKLKVMNNDLTNENLYLKNKLNDKEKEIDDLTSEILCLKNKLNNKDKEIYDLTNEILCLKNRLKDKDNKINDLTSENLYLKNKINLLEREKEAKKDSFFDSNGIQKIFKDTNPDIQKRRFRKLSQIFHPDSEIGDPEIFKMIKNAYEKEKAS